VSELDVPGGGAVLNAVCILDCFERVGVDVRPVDVCDLCQSVSGLQVEFKSWEVL
jgi:hypothetical protein